MAKSKKSRQRAHEARAARHEAHAHSKPHEHLPHSGTPENRSYLRRRQHEDLLAFGEFRRSRGVLPMVVAIVVGVLFALGILAWVFFFI